MSLFQFRRNLNQASPQQEKLLKNLLAYRDTWKEIPSPEFSMERVILRDRIEKHKKTKTKLIRSENGFRLKDKSEMNESEICLRSIQGALNKLTKQNYSTVIQSILLPQLINDESVLNGTVTKLFQKATAEPVFSGLYAQVIYDIARYEKSLRGELDAHSDSDDTKHSKVRHSLLTKCQDFFSTFVDPRVPVDEEDAESTRKNNMANIKFVGELYMLSTVSEKVVIHVCNDVVGNLEALTDAKVEMAISLLTVVGKKFDESKYKPAETEKVNVDIWELLRKCYEMKDTLSPRIRFLIQNLLELRANNWVKPSAGSKPPATLTVTAGPIRAVARSSDNNGGTSLSTNNRSNWQNNNSNRSDRQHMGSSTHNTNNNNNNKQGHRLEGYSASGAGTPGSHALSPTCGVPFPNIKETKEQAEEKKMISLATPPEALTKEIEELYVGSVRDALIEDKWEETIKTIKTALRKSPNGSGNDHVGPMCATYAIVKVICMSKEAEERESFTRALNKSEVFDVSALARGFAWFLTYAIVQNLREDYPLMSQRFQDAMMATPLPFCTVLRDVLARTANYLDALSTHDECELEQQEEFVMLWSAIVSGWKDRRPDEHVDPMAVLEALEAVKQRQYMQDIATDCLVELLNHRFITVEAVKSWIEKTESASKPKEGVKVLLDQLKELVSS